ncbi:hypothetical protein HWE06_16385 [Pantoea dispersa]|nr:hypothetical protein [Pantoea dispersa]
MIHKKMTALTGSALTHPSSSHKAVPGERTENIAVIKAAARTGQPLGSMPLDWSSLRMMRFIQAAKDSSPSCFCASSIAERKSLSSLNWKGWLPLRVFFCIDMIITPNCYNLCVITCYIESNVITTKPGSGGTLTGLLTKPLVGVTVMAINKHTQTRPRYQYRFLAVSRQDRSVPPFRLCTGAGSEQDIRCLALFPADPLPVQEVQNA